MAETSGSLGILPANSESPAEVSITESPTPLDPTAAAIAAEAAKSDPELATEVTGYFRKQSHLVEIQTEHLHEQRAVNLQLLKLKRFGDRLRIALQAFWILVAAAVGFAGILLIHDAASSRRVVIEPFDTPSALTSRGITGKVVAAGLLGELDRLQASTTSSAAKRDLTNAWSAEVELALPEAGVSIGELTRVLKRRLGHDVHIEGELVQTEAGGLELTVRGDGVAQKTVNGKADELARLTTLIAEHVYGQSEPALYATYLDNVERYAEAISFCHNAYASASRADRPYLLNSWAIAVQSTGGSNRDALALYRAAVKLQPDFWIAHTNIQNTLIMLGDEEGAWKAAEKMRAAAGGRPGRAREYNYGNWDYLTGNLGAWLASLVADAEENGGAGTGTSAVGPAVADVEVRMHDPEDAEQALKTTKDDPHDPSIAAMTHFVRGRLAAEAGDVARAGIEMEAFGVAYSDPDVTSNYPGYNCWIAPAEEAAGHPEKADALLKAAGTFVDCYRFNADILDGRGDWKGAQEWYAKTVELAPDLPAGYYSWGVALARHGDLAGAEAKLKDANKRGPHWADPLKAWGDVLLKQGKNGAALAKYTEALKFAPNWKQLKEAQATLAKQS